MEAGWSPTAAVTARLAGGALVMAVFASVVRPGWIREARSTHAPSCCTAWSRSPALSSSTTTPSHICRSASRCCSSTPPRSWWSAGCGRPPGAAHHLTLAGVALAVAGIMLVLGIVGPGGLAGAHINLVGVAWGLAAAVCAACYFLMSDKVGGTGPDGEDGLHPITLAAAASSSAPPQSHCWASSGLMPLTFTANDAVVAGFTTSWLVPVIALALFPTAIAYTLGIVGVARLRPRFASLVGLSEVMFAVLAAWMLSGEAMTAMQAFGGAVVLAGLALARQGDR